MIISTNWIKDYVNLEGLDIEKLIKQFTLSTAEVEEIIYKGNQTSNVVVAKVLSVENHPNSKKLHLLKVDTGDGIVDCVCGAPNVRENMLVAFAKAGGQVCGFAINEAMVGGYKSFGMCCSEQELEIGPDSSGLMEITDDVPLGTDIKSIYAVDDILFEVDNKSLTNRPDLWGHYGIAREFAAMTGRELGKIPQYDFDSCGLPSVKIDIKDTENAYRYTSVIVENITKKVSPKNMQIRLYYCGMRPINLLADLTNYLMLEMGQPMHAFDAEKVKKVEVQRFDKPFEFETLDNVKRTIDEQTLMITSDNKPVAIAGIMGGFESEIAESTSSVLLESATFDAVSVRKSSTRIGLRTDASARYEKSLDPEMTIVAVKRYLDLLMGIDGGARVVSSITDSYVKSFDEISITIDKAYIDRYTGIDIPFEVIANTLKALGFGADIAGKDIKVEVPSWRRTKDVSMKADLVEEVSRIYGYDNFSIKTTKSALAPKVNGEMRAQTNIIKDLLASKYSFNEIHSYIWCDARKFKELGLEIEHNVKISNSTSTDLTVLRNSLIPTLLTVAYENRYFADRVAIFEIAQVFENLDENGRCKECKKLGMVLMSKEKSEKETFFEMKNILGELSLTLKNSDISFENTETTHAWQHPINTSKISVNGTEIGLMGVIHPSVQKNIDKKANVVFAEIDMNVLATATQKDFAFEEPSKFPDVDIDLSLLTLKDIKFADIAEILKSTGISEMKGYKLVDIYTDKLLGDKQSVTVRINFGSKEKTLSSEEIQGFINKTVEAFGEKDIVLK